MRLVILAAVGAVLGYLAESVHRSAGVWTLPAGASLPWWIVLVYFAGLWGAGRGFAALDRRCPLQVTPRTTLLDVAWVVALFLAPPLLHQRELLLTAIAVAVLGARLARTIHEPRSSDRRSAAHPYVARRLQPERMRPPRSFGCLHRLRLGTPDYGGLTRSAHELSGLALRRAPGDLLVVLAVPAFDAAVEGGLVAAGLFRYTHASLGPFPLWLAPLWAGLGLGLRRLFAAGR